MRTMPLQLLTWGTITAAVGSAVWLSNTDQAAFFCSSGYRATSQAMGLDVTLPAEPAPAGASAKASKSGASKQSLEANAS